jgi:hypothetical protein
MALGINSIWECRQAATAANVNGGGFNPEATLSLTDLATTSGTSTTPTVTSATYTFEASDANAYLFVQSGTNWVPGWYKINAVGSGTATLTAAAGGVVTYLNPGATRSLGTSTANGCATQATPGGNATFTIDYSQQASHKLSIGDAVSTASTTITSVTGGFTKAMVGNILHLNSGTGTPTVGWYEIAGQTDTNTITVDVASGTYTVGAIRVGGALSLQSAAGATDDSAWEKLTGTNGSGAHMMFIQKSASIYSTVGAISLTSTGGIQAPVWVYGYNSLRPDGMGSTSLGTNRPTLNFGANALTLAANWQLQNLIITGTSGTLVTCGSASKIYHCRIVNTSTTAARNALTVTTDCLVEQCELVALRGKAINHSNSAGTRILFCYVHDSDIGFNSAIASSGQVIWGNIFAHCVTNTINPATPTQALTINANVLYGGETQIGTALAPATGATDISLMNNIICGFGTGILHADTQTVGADNYNNYYNNGTDVVKWQKGASDVAVDPLFTNVVERSGSSATTAASNVFTQSGATFQTWGVSTLNDILYISAGGTGTGTPVLTHYTIATVDSETQLTLGETLTAGGAGVSWTMRQGHNFAVGTNLKAVGYPGVFPAALTTGFTDIGAVQREEQGGGSTTYIFPVFD